MTATLAAPIVGGIGLLPVTDVGFTGTRVGMTPAQKRTILAILVEVQPQSAHHGDCVGADADFHRILRHELPFSVQIIGHPPLRGQNRAWCDFDVMRPEADYGVRDRHIVNESQLLIGNPRSFKEELRGSGTWLTIRYARQRGTPRIIVWPDGSVTQEQG